MTKKLTDEQVVLRDKIVFGEEVDWTKSCGGTFRYKDMSIDELEQLIKNGFIDLDERQNDSPTVEEFREFMKKYPDALAHGYVVSNDRPDVRVSIEGIEIAESDVTPEIYKAFVGLCRLADEFDDDGRLYSWWD